MKKIIIKGLELLVEFSFFIVGAIIFGVVYLYFTIENVEQYFNVETAIYLGLLLVLTYIPSFFAEKLQILAYKWNVKLKYLRYYVANAQSEIFNRNFFSKA